VTPVRALLVLCLVVAGCGGARNAPAQGETPGQARLVGAVTVTGSAPMNVRVTLRPDSASSVFLDGPLAPELRRLSGARVEIWGRREADAVQVSGYRIVSVDGAPVWMGTVERQGDGLALRLQDGSLIRLRYPPAELQPGRKVWVQGPAARAEVSVQTFGVISPE